MVLGFYITIQGLSLSGDWVNSHEQQVGAISTLGQKWLAGVTHRIGKRVKWCDQWKSRAFYENDTIGQFLIVGFL